MTREKLNHLFAVRVADSIADDFEALLDVIEGDINDVRRAVVAAGVKALKQTKATEGAPQSLPHVLTEAA